MINARHRFHGHNSVNRVYKLGKTVRTPYCAIKAAPSDRENYRAAVVVSKKVSKSAVTRNRMRRKIYELIRKHESMFISPYDFIVTVFNEQLDTMKASELERLVVSLLKDSRIIKTSKVQ